MATSKTLTPTNVTIQIPAMTDAPDQSVNSNCIDKLGDAVNTLNSKITVGDWISLNSTYGISYMKVSGILFVQCVYNGSDIPSSVLGTLPTGYRPKSDCRVRNYTGNGNLAVYANGEVRVTSTDWVNCILISPCAE